MKKVIGSLLNQSFDKSADKGHKLNRGFRQLATYSAAVMLGVAGVMTEAMTLSARRVEAANVADVAQLIETGICKGCDLTGANLANEHLIGADLREADLTDAVLSGANLEGADLTGATLVNTDLSGAFLTNALLDEALISNVDLSNSTLIYTSLENADVSNVDLLNAEVVNTPISIGGSYDQ
jgi:uncharacterized protein YjbI with pentapeptide repeats